jgi:AraC family transcriptional regulator
MKAQQLSSSISRDICDPESHNWAAEQAILVMRERFMQPLSLQELAFPSRLSQYHFNRIFHRVTGIPPIVFLSALRLERAKEFLLTTDLTTQEICFRVGYKSLGSFTHRFTQHVGLPPGYLRRLVKSKFIHSYLSMLRNSVKNRTYVVARNATPMDQMDGAQTNTVTGQLQVHSHIDGLIFVGLFSGPLPLGHPIEYTLVTEPGTYRIPSVPDGCYYLFAVTMNWAEDQLSFLLNETGLRGGTSLNPICILNGEVDGPTDLVLRQAQLIDPPMLVIPPLLFINSEGISPVNTTFSSASLSGTDRALPNSQK